MTFRYLFTFLFSIAVTLAFAKQIPPKPNPPRLVNDFAGMLSPSEAQALENKLVAYDDSTSTQIAIVTERSLDGDDDFDYALRIYNTWNIGQKDKNNGVLIYIALEDRKIRFITGYGAEGFLPDAIAKRIIENIIKPAFRDQQYYQGFDRATDAIISYAAGEYAADGSGEKGNMADLVIGLLILAVIVGFFLFILIAAIRSGKDHDDDDDGGYWRGGRYDEGRHRNRGGGWIFIPPIGGGGSSGGGGWSSGGGGFGGFGGGFSGGGGAGGSW